MLIQISSGQGPPECELAVGLLANALKREFPDVEVVKSVAGQQKNCFGSVVLKTDADISSLEGTVEWICQSPFRPHHKRKNWFIRVAVLPDTEEINDVPDCKIEYFHCGGKGGQNVNKVETGVRLTHLPTGIIVTASEERTQQTNRKIALKKLQDRLRHLKNQSRLKSEQAAWHSHYQLVRGNPVRIYIGMDFKLQGG